MPTWIDFKELRSKLKFEEVLKHYGVEVKRRGEEQHMGVCPLPGHPADRKSPSFSANLERGIFQCFVCKSKGNVLDFAVLMSGAVTDDGRAVKKVAAELRAKFFPEDAKENGRKVSEARPEKPAASQLELGPVINAPLDFELQGLDPTNACIAGLGLVPATIARFGLGFCSRGLLRGRIAIPLHDADGRLIGYAGQAVGDKVDEANPRYRFPTTREHGGKVFEFRKDLLVYNRHRLKTPCESLIVVQSFPAVWWLTQNGFGQAVATMGPECSSEQIGLILSAVPAKGLVWIMSDGDDAGGKLAELLLGAISPHRLVRWAKLENGEVPTDLATHDLKVCLTE